MVLQVQVPTLPFVEVVFDTGKRGDTEGGGYAVYLWDIAPQAFADSLGIAQGTSSDIMAYDGNENTFALYDTRAVSYTHLPHPILPTRRNAR